MNDRKSLAVLVSALALLVLVASIPPAKAQFAIASWDFPDQYGQGITKFLIYENSSGSWVQFGDYVNYGDDGSFNWNVSVGIKLRCWALFNSTLTGAATTAEGKLYQRRNVSVTNREGATVFSQQNFTYVAVDTGLDPLWLYSYDVVLNFLPQYGQAYAVTIIYEVFYA